MKLIGSYTSPFVRKISVLLLEKGITFEFVNDPPYEPASRVTDFNPLGKVPVLITKDGVFYDSKVIAEYLELLSNAPAFLPADRNAALHIRQIEALADGITDAAATLYRESQRDIAKANARRKNRTKSGFCVSVLRSFMA
jgi:glutathione S-transferase